MVLVSHSDLMEDNRFKEIKKIKKKELLPQLKWFAGEDYFSEELFGFHLSEIENLKFITSNAYSVFEKATNKIINDQQLDYLNIPRYFQPIIEKTWKERNDYPFMYGRFDINGGLDSKEARIIEFNADTCSTIPETIYWQQTQLKMLKGKLQFNELASHLEQLLRKIKSSVTFQDAYFLASSFGYIEDQLNCETLLDIASKCGYNSLYANLEDVTFSEDQGVLYNMGKEYQPVDVWFKLIPWDWMFNEEPELAKTLITIIEKKLCVVLNPPYTAIWQNKRFLAYITEHFPNRYIAETYLDTSKLSSYVSKPVYGRLGENINIVGEDRVSSKGEYESQQVVYQKYYPLPSDSENYYYQIGMFYSDRPSALNLRTQNSKIITDDCEFMSHYII